MTDSRTFRDNVTETIDSCWKGLFIAGGMAAFAMLVLMIVQIIVFVIWPPPATVAGYFSLFQENWFLGLLSLDLLLSWVPGRHIDDRTLDSGNAGLFLARIFGTLGDMVGTRRAKSTSVWTKTE